jgi:uncharacterized protein
LNHSWWLRVNRKSFWGNLFAVALLFFSLPSFAASSLQVPALRAPITDLAGVLKPVTIQRLNAALTQLHQQAGSQIAVLTLPSLNGLTIEEASIQIVDQWKLGTAKEDKGLLLLIAPNERRLRIEVGQGLEGQLTDAHSKRIISETMIPLIREGDMDGAVVAGVYRIIQHTDPQVDAEKLLNGIPRTSHGLSHNRQLSHLMLLIFLLVLLMSLSGRWGGGSYWTGGWGGGGFGGGFGGGGFGGGGGFSGGGGGFSGGGASGSW